MLVNIRVNSKYIPVNIVLVNEKYILVNILVNSQYEVVTVYTLTK